jgi:ABC-type phosphate transport system permease subunit
LPTRGVVEAWVAAWGNAQQTVFLSFHLHRKRAYAHQLSWSLFAPGNSIASTLANEFAEAEAGLHMSSLFALGLILFVITFIVLAAAKLMLLKMSKGEGSK